MGVNFPRQELFDVDVNVDVDVDVDVDVGVDDDVEVGVNVDVYREEYDVASTTMLFNSEHVSPKGIWLKRIRRVPTEVLGNWLKWI